MDRLHINELNYFWFKNKISVTEPNTVYHNSKSLIQILLKSVHFNWSWNKNEQIIDPSRDDRPTTSSSCQTNEQQFC